MISGPSFVPSDVDPAAVLSSLDADEPLVVVVAHVAELVLVPRIPKTKIEMFYDFNFYIKCTNDHRGKPPYCYLFPSKKCTKTCTCTPRFTRFYQSPSFLLGVNRLYQNIPGFTMFTKFKYRFTRQQSQTIPPWLSEAFDHWANPSGGPCWER